MEKMNLSGHFQCLHSKPPKLDIQAAGKYDLVDALVAAISWIRLSEPQKEQTMCAYMP
jgi:hypothetical protein